MEHYKKHCYWNLRGPGPTTYVEDLYCRSKSPCCSSSRCKPGPINWMYFLMVPEAKGQHSRCPVASAIATGKHDHRDIGFF